MLLNHFRRLQYNFTFDFFQNKKINPFLGSVFNKIDNSEIININHVTISSVGNELHEIKFVPPYFDVKLSDNSSSYKHIKFYRIDDFMVNLEGYADIESYLKGIMNSKQRKQLRSKTRRLETCFPITYRFHYGAISRDHYDYLFKHLELLINRRFDQRQDVFYLQDHWSYLIEHTYQLILEKRASFFVIYDGEKPISIGLSYHFQNIMQSLISSYDIDYSKFGIGQLANLKKIDWCFKNNFKIFDLMWGEVSHKLFWCNSIRPYEHHFIYKNNLLFKSAYVQLLINLYRIKDYLKKKKITKSLLNCRKTLKNYFQSHKKRIEFNIKSEVIESLPLNDSMTKIDIAQKQYAFLRKPLYDFQYLNFAKTEEVGVFEINNLEKYYIIMGTKSKIKVIVDHI
ncbi:MAG: GNAT family N-acetyltransferase [Flavobacteriaceae bacterium]|nr:GNAT family N-acetyltransferase [Bacteroidia bacterium]NNL15085.1 GNAT family N-acetyltransferase [Flavobacteriaceae bacterium]